MGLLDLFCYEKESELEKRIMKLENDMKAVFAVIDGYIEAQEESSGNPCELKTLLEDVKVLLNVNMKDVRDEQR